MHVSRWLIQVMNNELCPFFSACVPSGLTVVHGGSCRGPSGWCLHDTAPFSFHGLCCARDWCAAPILLPYGVRSLLRLFCGPVTLPPPAGRPERLGPHLFKGPRRVGCSPGTGCTWGARRAVCGAVKPRAFLCMLKGNVSLYFLKAI